MVLLISTVHVYYVNGRVTHGPWNSWGTISWSWNVSDLYHSFQDCPIDFHIRQCVRHFMSMKWVLPNILMARALRDPFWVIIHMTPMCVAQSATQMCGTIKSWSRSMNFNQHWAVLYSNVKDLDLISVYHVYIVQCEENKRLAAHTIGASLSALVRNAKNRLPSKLCMHEDYRQICLAKFAIKVHFSC